MTVKYLPYLFVCSTAMAAPCPKLQEKNLSSERVYALTQNPNCKIKSAKDLISHLPEKFRSQFALFYRSRSVQGPNLTDYKRPRVILFDEISLKKPPYTRQPSRFMLSFNSGDPDQPGSDSLEMVDINTKGGKNDLNVFKYRDITFTNGKAKLSGVNPKKCATCHGDPARPIYPGYPDWEGSFGSLHAYEPGAPGEREAYREFKEAVAASPDSRYRLIGPLSVEGEFNPLQVPGLGNDAINGELGHSNAIRVARLMMKTKDFSQFKFAIAAALMNCAKMESFVSPETAKSLHQNIDQRFGLTKKWSRDKIDGALKGIYNTDRQFQLVNMMFEKTPDNPDEEKRHPESQFRKMFQEQFASSPAMERLYVDTFTVQGTPRADSTGGSLRFVMEGRNINIDNYFLDLMQPTYRYQNGAHAAHYTVLEMARHDKDLAAVMKGHVTAKHGMNEYIEGEEKICAKLKKKSLAATRNYKPSTLEPTEGGVPCLGCDPAPTVKNTYPHLFSQSCASCHDSEMDYAPPIPFSDPARFRAWLAQGENAAKVRERLLHPNEELRMPQNRRLNDDDVNELIRYISIGSQ